MKNKKQINQAEYLLILSKLEEVLDQLEWIERKMSKIEETIDKSIISVDYKLFTPREISERIGVHYNTVLEWIKQGKLVPMEGGKGKVSGLEIKRFIETHSKYTFR